LPEELPPVETKVEEAIGLPFVERAAELAKPPEERSLWLEVRPYIGQELRIANYLDAISVMHGLGGEFEFLMASGPDPAEIGRVPEPRRVVRYFVRCPDETSRDVIKNVLINVGFDVSERRVEFEGNSLLWWEPDVRVRYEMEAELELAAHYGSTPLVPEEERYERTFEQFVRPIENLHAALLGGGALRVAVRAEDKAKLHVKIPGVSRDGAAARDAAVYHASGFARSLLTLGRPDGIGEETRRAPPQVDWRALEEHTRRVSRPWFVCDVRAYGTEEQIRGIIAALVYPRSRFKMFRRRRTLGELKPRLMEARATAWRYATLLPLAIPLLLLWRGLWNPMLVLEEPSQLLPLALALALPPTLRAVWRPRKTVAMTAGELSLLVSLPSKPEAGHFYFAVGRPRVEVKERLPQAVTAEKG
jgi:hypothetical protein